MRISLAQASDALKTGQVIAVHTETVYGLAACLESPSAIEKVFALKGRPRANPLIIHVADRKELNPYVVSLPSGFDELANAFWPGPLTLILPVNANVPSIVRAGLPTAGFRIPAPALTRSLIKATGPLVMPSANLSGHPSSTRPEHVEEDFGQSFPVLDGGVCSKGVESTIMLFQEGEFQEGEWVIVRLGALASDQFERVLGYKPRFIQAGNHSQPLCPGQHYRHYAPKAKLILGDLHALQGASTIIGFKERIYPPGKQIIVLSSLESPEEAAENLYQVLRQLDQEGVSEVWVDIDFPKTGLWQTIAERLMRAGE